MFMTTPSTGSTIDSATKVNIGILITMLATIGSGGMFFGSIKSEIGQMNSELTSIRQAFERAASQAQIDGRDLSANRARITSLEDAVRRIEQRVKDIEKNAR